MHHEWAAANLYQNSLNPHNAELMEIAPEKIGLWAKPVSIAFGVHFVPPKEPQGL